VTGYVGRDDDKQQVAAQLANLSNAGRVNSALTVMDWPLCEMLGILHTQTAWRQSDPGVPQIEAGGELGTYFTNDRLKPTITATSLYDGYLYIDYVDGADDAVVHLSPNDIRPDDLVPKGSKVKIGTLRAEDYVIGPPYGTSLIVAISSPVRLFAGPRPKQEKETGAKEYLAELRRQLQRVAADGYQNSLVSSYSVLTLVQR
jgi:hypothetical protein